MGTDTASWRFRESFIKSAETAAKDITSGEYLRREYLRRRLERLRATEAALDDRYQWAEFGLRYISQYLALTPSLKKVVRDMIKNVNDQDTSDDELEKYLITSEYALWG